MAEIVASKPVNEASDKEIRTRSSFPLNYAFYQTMRFAECTPHFVQEGVDSDVLPLQSSHEIMSFTLSSPLLSDIKINKDYFAVPLQAILPLNYDKWYTVPSIGQRAPVDAGPSVEGFWNKIGDLFGPSFTAIGTYLGTSGNSVATGLDMVCKFLVFFERFYSDGCLLANLGIHGNQFCKFTRNSDGVDFSYDEFFDWYVGQFIDDTDGGIFPYFTIQYGSDASRQFNVVFDPSNTPTTGPVHISFRDYLELLRDDFTWTVIATHASLTLSNLASQWTSLASQVSRWVLTSATGNDKVHCDLRRPWAYQLACWHYFTNDKVDYIYSAELFRQYIYQISCRQGSVSPNAVQAPHFSINGLDYLYDALSAFIFDTVITGFTSSGIFGYTTGSGTYHSDNIQEAYAYFRACFGFNNSLRFKDYFVGSRTRPLAVGNIDVQVNSNLVNIIDVTRNIQRQRFFNAVNRIPRQIEDYLEGLFGKRPAPDFHNPFWLGRTTDNVFAAQNEYTGNVTDSEANNITSVLRSNASRYCFEYKADRDIVIIGITSYDIPRAYSSSIERQALHLDPLDGFNPYMQFIGDQEVYKAELGSKSNGGISGMQPFGYQLRHMEYKQRFDQCAGAFRKFLPGWLFIADNVPLIFADGSSNVSPEYIRSHNCELDHFYKHLTGYSLGSYFHFIVKNVNTQTASRPMAYAPSIL